MIKEKNKKSKNKDKIKIYIYIYIYDKLNKTSDLDHEAESNTIEDPFKKNTQLMLNVEIEK
jgi:hypothetical protein